MTMLPMSVLKFVVNHKNYTFCFVHVNTFAFHNK